MNQIPGITTIDDLFNTVTSDTLISRMLYRTQTLHLARVVGFKVPKNRLTETDIVARTRQHWEQNMGPRACSGCVLSGRRWVGINEGRPLLYRLEVPSLLEAFGNAEVAIADALTVITATNPNILIREAYVGETPDVTIRGDEIDGQLGTLGFATTFTRRGSDDLDVGGDAWISADLVVDQAELWDYAYFFTVFSHEMMHILGLDHAPATAADDLMRPFYAGPRRDYGEWTLSELKRRYTGVLPA